MVGTIGNQQGQRCEALDDGLAIRGTAEALEATPEARGPSCRPTPRPVRASPGAAGRSARGQACRGAERATRRSCRRRGPLSACARPCSRTPDPIPGPRRVPPGVAARGAPRYSRSARVTAAVLVRSPLTMTARSSRRGSMSRLVGMCGYSHNRAHSGQVDGGNLRSPVRSGTGSTQASGGMTPLRNMKQP